MKIVTWNVNSIRSRLQHVLDFLRAYSPDIVLLQELKVETAGMPMMEIEELGYNIAAHGQKTYNGVAILSKYPLDDIVTVLPGDESDVQARYIEAVASVPGGVVRVASIYVPNGQAVDSDKFPYKLKFLERLKAHAETLLAYEEPLILGADYNVSPYREDVFDPVASEGHICYHPEERARLRALMNLGLYDAWRMLHPGVKEFSWWDYRAGCFEQNKGLRIDHLLLSPQAADALRSSEIVRSEREKEKPSDHAPVMATFAL